MAGFLFQLILKKKIYYAKLHKIAINRKNIIPLKTVIKRIFQYG